MRVGFNAKEFTYLNAKFEILFRSSTFLTGEMSYQLGEHVQRTDFSNIKELAKDILKTNKNQEDSFFIMNTDELIYQYELWESALPNIKPYYAVKCNDSTVVLKVLAALGANFDCASQGEIKKVLSLGVQPSRIIYANPNKQLSHIKYAASVGVRLMTFDNESELQNIKTFHPKAQLLIRIAADADDIVHRMSHKFGVSPAGAEPLVRKCLSLKLDLVGVCFHVGSFCLDSQAFDMALNYSRQVYDYCNSLGIRLRFVDVGGGFVKEKFDELASSLHRGLAANFSDVEVELLAEPGRFLVNCAYSLVAQVNSIRNDAECDQPIYYINDSITTSFGLCLYGNESFKILPLERNNSKYERSSLFGHTCNPVDVIAKDCLLPQLEAGDWLLFTNMGAYSLNLACRFQGFNIAEVYHCSKNSWSFLEEHVPELTVTSVSRGSKRLHR